MMKKRFCILLSLIAILLFCVSTYSCFLEHYYDYNDLIENVEKVEIINITDGRKEVLKALSEEEMEEFFQDLSEIKYTTIAYGSKPEVSGIAVELYYKNGETEVFNWARRTSTCNKYEFAKMLEKYLDPYEVTDIAQYRTIPDTNYYDKYIAEYSNLVLPKKIEDFFIVEKYSLRFNDWDEIHEEYLEIRIEDEMQYQEYVNGIVGEKETGDFFYDTRYQEYNINDYLQSITWTFKDSETLKGISKAKIQKILFSDELNTIVFVSLVVPEHNGVVVQDKFYYFERFNIEGTTYHNGVHMIREYE